MTDVMKNCAHIGKKFFFMRGRAELVHCKKSVVLTAKV